MGMAAAPDAPRGKAPRPRSARMWPRLVLAATSLVVALVAAEVALRIHAHLLDRGILSEGLELETQIPADRRVTLGQMIRLADDPDIIYRLRPNLDVIYADAPVITNSAGFRGPEVAISKPPGTVRIVGLGDSFMFGQGVADGACYLDVLRRRLDEELGPARAEVINTAVPGYNTVMEVETLRSVGLAYDPDIVIISYVGNDLSLPNFIRVPRPVLDLRHSFLRDAFRAGLAQLLRRTTSTRTRLHIAGVQGLDFNDRDGLAYAIDPAQVPERYRHMVGWQAYAAALERLADLSREHGFHLLWITLKRERGPRKEEAMRTARALGIATLDIGAVLSAEVEKSGSTKLKDSPLTLSPSDPHPSVLAHRITAATLYDELVRRGWLDRGDISVAHDP